MTIYSGFWPFMILILEGDHKFDHSYLQQMTLSSTFETVIMLFHL